MQHLELTLITADGRIGKERLSEPSTMVWSGGPETDGETVSATFELTHKGVVLDSFDIDGDDWRQMESQGRGVAAVWAGIQRGWEIVDAVYAAQYNEDPLVQADQVWQAEQEMGKVQEELAEANAKLAMALAHLNKVMPLVFTDRLASEDYEAWQAACNFLDLPWS